MASAIQKQLARFETMKLTALAVAEAAGTLADTLTDAKDIKHFASMARRTDTCARSTHVRVVRPKDDEPYVRCTNKRGCHTRFCPFCQRNISRILRALIEALLIIIWTMRPTVRRTSMLMLSTRNRPMSECSAMLDDHLAALERFFERDDVSRMNHGAITSLECVIRGPRAAPEAGWHSHHLLATDEACYGPGRYMTYEAIQAAWKASARLDYDPMCWIQAVEHDAAEISLAGALREVAKYCVKGSSLRAPRPHTDLLDVLDHDPLPFINPQVLYHLDRAVFRRRLTGRMSGVWQDALKAHRAGHTAECAPSPQHEATASDSIPF